MHRRREDGDDTPAAQAAVATGATEKLDMLQGLQGLDMLQGLQGLDMLQGLQGLDILQGLQGLDMLQGLQRLDILQGLQRLDILQGLQRLDILQGLQRQGSRASAGGSRSPKRPLAASCPGNTQGTELSACIHRDRASRERRGIRRSDTGKSRAAEHSRGKERSTLSGKRCGGATALLHAVGDRFAEPRHRHSADSSLN